MVGKERVKALLEHRKPDRIPMGEVEIDAPIVEAVLGRPTYYRSKFRLMKAFWEGKRDEVVDSMKRDYVEFLKKTEHDTAIIYLVPDREATFYPLRQIGPLDYKDENDNLFRYSEQTQELMHIGNGRGPVKLMSCSEQSDMPPAPTESEIEFAMHVIEELKDTHYIVAPHLLVPDMPYRRTNYFGDMLEGIIDRPIEYRNERIALASQVKYAAEFYKRLGCDAIVNALDLGHNQGTLMSPKCFREILFPGLKAEVDHAHAAGMDYILHSCGNNREIWHSFAESGMDVYQAIQEEEPLDELKKEIGNSFALWGGVSCRLLDTSTPSQIRKQTERSMEIASKKGGVILGSSHSLGVGVKIENYMTMFEVWKQYR
jgi:uroporphyrinogen decarboxylase